MASATVPLKTRLTVSNFFCCVPRTQGTNTVTMLMLVINASGNDINKQDS
jgi:hypothetical protein